MITNTSLQLPFVTMALLALPKRTAGVLFLPSTWVGAFLKKPLWRIFAIQYLKSNCASVGDKTVTKKSVTTLFTIFTTLTMG